MPKRVNPEISVQRMLELMHYDKEQGVITQKQLGKKMHRKVLPDPDNGAIVLYDPSTGLRQKMLYRSLAYVLGSGKPIPEGKKVLCHDLDDENIKFRNLKLVDKAAYRDVQIAIRNLEGEMKIVQHPRDKHAYLLIWKEHRRTRNSVHYDKGSADDAFREKELEMVKFINQHIVSN